MYFGRASRHPKPGKTEVKTHKEWVGIRPHNHGVGGMAQSIKQLLHQHKDLGLIPWPYMKVPEVLVCTRNYNPGEEEMGSLGFPVSQDSLLGEFRSVRKTRWVASWGMAPKVVLWHPHVCAHTNTQNIRFKENCIKTWRPQQAHDQDGVLSDNFLTLRGPWFNLCPGI